MKNKFDKFLFAFLWLTVCVLGMTFWFNSQYGFNLFYGAHWRHLAYMQASQAPVNPMFYVSLVVGAVIILFGLHTIVKPQLRKIKLPIRDTKPLDTPQPSRPESPVVQTAPSEQPQPQTPAQNITQHTPVAAPVTPQPTAQIITPPAQTPVIPEPEAAQPNPNIPHMAPALTRPPRLNTSAITPIFQPPQQTATPSAAPTASVPPATQPAQQSSEQWAEIPEMFEKAGYTIKPNIAVGNTKSAVLALGANETLWIGAVGVTTSDLQNTINKLEQIFDDILDDIEININSFVVNARDAANPEEPDIQLFDSMSELREFISANPNPELSDSEKENFEAFSTFISTVIDYIGMM